MNSNGKGNAINLANQSGSSGSTGLEFTKSEFLNPKSMITPGIAGGTTMLITNAMCCSFELECARPHIALMVSALFAIAAVSVIKMSYWQKSVFFILNTLIVFSMALGTNTAGERGFSTNILDESKIVGTINMFVTDAFANEYPESCLLKGSNLSVYIITQGKRHFIPDPQTFDALGLNGDEVRQVSDEELNVIPMGLDYPCLISSVVKGSGPKVYLLKNGYKCWIPDKVTFDSLGFRVQDIQVIPDQELQLIPEAASIKKKRRFFAPWLSK